VVLREGLFLAVGIGSRQLSVASLQLKANANASRQERQGIRRRPRELKVKSRKFYGGIGGGGGSRMPQEVIRCQSTGILQDKSEMLLLMLLMLLLQHAFDGGCEGAMC